LELALSGVEWVSGGRLKIVAEDSGWLA